MFRPLFILIWSLFAFEAFAQVSVLKNDVIEEVRAKREKLIEAIEKNDLQSIQMDNLKSRGTYSTITLDEKERLLLLKEDFLGFLNCFDENQEYARLAANMRLLTYHGNEILQTYKYSRLAKDSLLVKIDSSLLAQKAVIQEKIALSGLSEVRIGFIQLCYLNYLMNADFCNIELESELLNESQTFLKKFPETPHAYLVSEYFNLAFELGNLGSEIILNTGSIFPSSNFSEYITPAALVDLSFNFNYTRLYLLTDLGIGLGGSTYKGLFRGAYNAVGFADTPFTYLTSDVSFGARIIDLPKFGITPFAGVRMTRMLAKKALIEESSYSYSPANISSIVFGINADFNWQPVSCNHKLLYRRGARFESLNVLARISLSTANTGVSNWNNSNLRLWALKFGIGYHYKYKRKQVENE